MERTKVIHCVEKGCGNLLTDEDRQRYPETLSQPWPAVEQTVSNNINIINMRLRCSHCYESKYSQFTSISYRWDLADYREATATFNAWEDGKCTKVPVPIVRNGQVKTIMNTDLFFFDKANARSDGGQWEPENVAKTYGSGGKMLCLLNNKDRRIIDYNREDSIHQAPRDRGSYTDSPYGKQERAFGYSHLDSSKVRFIGPDGRDLGNIEVTGLIKEDRNIYGKLAASGNILPGCNNPRQAMEKITEMFPVPAFTKTKKPTRRDNPFIPDDIRETVALISGSSKSKSKSKSKQRLTPGLYDSTLSVPTLSPSNSVAQVGNTPQHFMSTFPISMPMPAMPAPASDIMLSATMAQRRIDPLGFMFSNPNATSRSYPMGMPTLSSELDTLSGMMAQMNVTGQSTTFAEHNAMHMHTTARANPYLPPFDGQSLNSLTYGNSLAFNSGMSYVGIPTDYSFTATPTTNVSTKGRSRRQGPRYHAL